MRRERRKQSASLVVVAPIVVVHQRVNKETRHLDRPIHPRRFQVFIKLFFFLKRILMKPKEMKYSSDKLTTIVME